MNRKQTTKHRTGDQPGKTLVRDTTRGPVALTRPAFDRQPSTAEGAAILKATVAARQVVFKRSEWIATTGVSLKDTEPPVSRFKLLPRLFLGRGNAHRGERLNSRKSTLTGDQ